MTKQYPEVTLSIIPNSTVYVFSIQARNPEGAASAELTIGQIEAARNAAAATLETTGAIIDSTASIVNVPASDAKSTLTLTPTVETSEGEAVAATTDSDGSAPNEETTAADQNDQQTEEGAE